MPYVMHVDVIPAEERGITQNEWLISHHTYSFGEYHNLQRLNFGTLRVFNDDIIEAGKGFHTHSHNNMEIVTIVLEGALEHKDSKGNQGVLRAGDVQRMSAGAGIKHSEYNASQKEQARILQVWVYPDKRDLPPAYEQKHFPAKQLENCLYPIVKRGEKEALSIHQDAQFFLGFFGKNKTIEHTLTSKKHGDYLFVIEGEVALGDNILKKGDSAQIVEIEQFTLKTLAPSRLLLIEVGVNTL